MVIINEDIKYNPLSVRVFVVWGNLRRGFGSAGSGFYLCMSKNKKMDVPCILNGLDHNVRRDDFLLAVAGHIDVVALEINSPIYNTDDILKSLSDLRNILIVAQESYRLVQR